MCYICDICLYLSEGTGKQPKQVGPEGTQSLKDMKHLKGVSSHRLTSASLKGTSKLHKARLLAKQRAVVLLGQEDSGWGLSLPEQVSTEGQSSGREVATARGTSGHWLSAEVPPHRRRFQGAQQKAAFGRQNGLERDTFSIQPIETICVYPK